MDLKTSFNIALAAAGISAAEFARQRGFTRQAVCNTLSGRYKSRKIIDQVTEFTESHFKKIGLNSKNIRPSTRN